MKYQRAFTFAMTLWLLAFLPNAVWGDEGKLTFNRDIRPILSENCFTCHGPDNQKRKADLRLDLKEHAYKVGDAGVAAVVPGKVSASELLRRVTTNQAFERMPPKSFGKTLTKEQIAKLKRWIDEGAEYEAHWAFVTPKRPALPTPKKKDWARNAIDHFVLAELERAGLQPSPEASKETLIRRLSLDLTGLPPTPAEVDAFLNDKSADAYEKLVDRLLASPRYGEHMTAQWLDLARYADSNGYQVDSSRYNWPWRDWVIRAYNSNMPFDQFTVEQLAGDLLPNSTRSQIMATGFNRNHRLNGEGGIIAEEWRVETVIDRLETTATTWLALTMNCCRCHDHKYDPISQKEFYQMYAFFNNIQESGTLNGEARNTPPVLSVPTPEQEEQLALLEEELQAAEKKLEEGRKELPNALRDWEPKFRDQLQNTKAMWSLLEPNSVKSVGGATLTRQSDDSWLASGTNPSKDTYVIEASLVKGEFTGFLLETFPDPSLPMQSLGRYPNGNYVLSAVEAEISAPEWQASKKAKFASAAATYSQNNYDIKLVIQPNSGRGWAIDGNDPSKRLPRKAMFLTDGPLSVPENAKITIRLRHEAIDRHNIGRFRISTTGLPANLVKLDGTLSPNNLLAILNTPVEKRSKQQQQSLLKYFESSNANPLSNAKAVVNKLKTDIKSLEKNMPTCMVMQEMAKPRDAYFLHRGEYDKRGEKVTAGLPAALPPLPKDAPVNRLGLAQWIVDPSNPLTARVWVNRAWSRFFGAGIVKTTENFGSQAEWPSHPDLLDWMATEFVRLKWDRKAMHKLIVMSATYRQSSQVTQQHLETDPENRLLARAARFRLSAEAIRDQALAVSGLLHDKIGGPPVRPYMPQGVWDETSRYGDLRNYKTDKGPNLYRRTMYTIWKRTAAPPTLLIFDAPNREVCTVKRSRTNTPLQALALLNEVTYVEAARKLGERMMLEGGETNINRLTYGFRCVTGRQPTPRELKVLTSGWQKDLEYFRSNADAAKQILAHGESSVNPALALDELAAYAVTANVLLNLDEVVTRE